MFGFKIEFYETATGEAIKSWAPTYKTASESAAVFLSFLAYWDRHYGRQTEFAWRSA